MNPLIITATPNISWMHPEVPYPQTVEALVAEARLCSENGATILHTHAEGRWGETIRALRASTPLIIQAGMSSLPIPARLAVFEERADMISIILNHHDEAFVRAEANVLHPKSELEEYSRLCRENGVVPELEVWHAGSIWNLDWMIRNQLASPPYVTTLFFAWPGGTWSPPTLEEYLYRRRLMPEHCLCTVSIMGPEQIDILTAAILRGDNIRVGTEDYPFNRAGEVTTTHELVKEAAQVARSVGRRVATVEEARAIAGLPEEVRR